MRMGVVVRVLVVVGRVRVQLVGVKTLRRGPIHLHRAQARVSMQCDRGTEQVAGVDGCGAAMGRTTAAGMDAVGGVEWSMDGGWWLDGGGGG